MLPYYLQNLPFDITNDHNYDTRKQHTIRTMRPNHEYARKCLRYDIPMVMNSSPVEIINKINTHSVQGFAGHIKHTILQSYQVNCIIINCYICSTN